MKGIHSRVNRAIFLVVNLFLAIVITAVAGPVGVSAQDAESGILNHLDYDRYVFTYGDLTRLPVRSLTDMLLLLPGVTPLPRSGMNTPEFHVRGGRYYDHDYYLNGVLFTNPIIGDITATISPRVIDRLGFYPSGNGPEIGRSGAPYFDIRTRAGGDRYTGTVVTVSDNVHEGHDQNWYTIGLGGPVPRIVPGHFNITGERRWWGDRRPSDITEYTLPGSPLELPGNWLGSRSFHGRLDLQPRNNVDVGLAADVISDDWSEYRHQFLFDIDHTPRFEDDNTGISARIRHRIRPGTSYEVMAAYFSSERIEGDGTLFDDLDSYRRPFSNPGYDQWRIFRTNSYPIPASWIDHTVPFNSPADTIVMYAPSYYNYFLHHKSTYININAGVNQRIGRYHSLRAGLDFKRYTLRYYENINPTTVYSGYGSDEVDRYGFDIHGELTDDVEYPNKAKHPTDLNIFIGDRFEWRDFALRAELHYTRYDYNALVFKDPVYPLDPGGLTAVNKLDPGDLESSPTFDYATPRFGLTVTPRDDMRLFANYERYVRRPPFRYIYVGFDYAAANLQYPIRYMALPSARLAPERTTQYELGLEYRPVTDAALSATFYYREINDQLGLRYITAFPLPYEFYDNDTYERAHGLEFVIHVTHRQRLDLNVQYTLTWAKGQDELYASYSGIFWQNPQLSPVLEPPLDYDRRHNVVATINLTTLEKDGPRWGKFYPLAGFNLSAIVHILSGRLYTLMDVYDPVNEYPQNPITVSTYNGKRMPAQYVIDMKLERTIAVGEFRITPFFWVMNLLDRQNIEDVWNSSGLPNDTRWLETEEAQEYLANNPGSDLLYRYQLKEHDPLHYSAPRQFYIGVRAEI